MTTMLHVLFVGKDLDVLELLDASLDALERPYDLVDIVSKRDIPRLFQDEPFDLMVTALGGPKSLALFQRAREEHPDVPLILIVDEKARQLEGVQDLEAYKRLDYHPEADEWLEILREVFHIPAPAQKPPAPADDVPAPLDDPPPAAAPVDKAPVSAPKDAAVHFPNNDHFQQTDALLRALKQNVGALGVLLVNAAGHIVLQLGAVDDLPLDEVVPLLSGGLATLLEAGHALDGSQDAVHLAYREGVHYDLYGLNIGTSFVLILFISRSEYATPLGSVWYYARRSAEELRDILCETGYSMPDTVIDQNFGEELGDELDDLFGVAESG